jgi:type II secretory pathway pseudopilin PulG
VELLVVIAIIGILATLILLQLGGARARARDTQRISHINQLVNAMELYFEDNGQYTDTLTDLGPFFSGGKVPVDPLNNAVYKYTLYTNDFGGSGFIDSYQFTAELEQNANALDNDSDIDGTNGNWGVDGSADQNCTTAPDDCIYDRGVDASL